MTMTHPDNRAADADGAGLSVPIRHPERVVGWDAWDLWCLFDIP